MNEENPNDFEKHFRPDIVDFKIFGFDFSGLFEKVQDVFVSEDHIRVVYESGTEVMWYAI